MVFDLVTALGVPLSPEIATHIYVAILTDTGSFHFSSISPRTFDICRHAARGRRRSGARRAQVFDSSTMGRLKLLGAVLSGMHLDPTGASRCSISITRWRARPAARTTTPTG